MEYFQTGDLLYFKTDILPKDLEEIKTGVILHSDTTGHNHKVHGAKLLKDKDGTMYISTSDLAVLTHEEHKDLALPAGNYRVQIVKEYDHMLEEARNVID